MVVAMVVARTLLWHLLGVTNFSFKAWMRHSRWVSMPETASTRQSSLQWWLKKVPMVHACLLRVLIQVFVRVKMADVLTGVCSISDVWIESYAKCVLRERIDHDCRSAIISTHLGPYFWQLHGEEEPACHQSSGFRARRVENSKEVDLSLTGAAWLERLTRKFSVWAKFSKSVTVPWLCLTLNLTTWQLLLPLRPLRAAQ